MKFPELCLPYMANDGGLASVVILCRHPPAARATRHKHPEMGRKQPLRVRWPGLRRRDPGHEGETLPTKTANAECDQGEYRMNCFRPIRFALVALVPAAAISLGIANELAEPPAATPPAAPPAPAVTPAPTASPPAAPAKPAATETPAASS